MNENTSQRSRRDLLKAGVTLVPVVITLHAVPAHASTDYTTVAYRYGVNAGLCRNPNHDPTSETSSEFVACGQSQQPIGDDRHTGGPSWEPETQPTSGTQQISF